MPTVDFEAWAIPGLDLVLGGVTYAVAPPSTDGMGKLYALAVLGEIRLGVKPGPVPVEVQAVLDTIGAHEHPSLGVAHQRMVDAGLHPTTIDRAAYYSVYYWTHGRAYADAMARLYFEEQQTAVKEAGEPAPKAPTRSPRKSGRSTGSASRSAKRTGSPSTPTTELHP